MAIDVSDCWIRNHMLGGRMFEEDLIRRIIGPKITKARYIIDAGANIGCHTISYARMNPEARIWSFEPQDSLHDILQFNVKNNNLEERVTISKQALGHAEGQFNFVDESTQFHPGHGVNKGGIGLGSGGQKVTMTTIDALGLPGLDYMKIDVEGAEGLVIQGGKKTIAKYKPIICFEHNFQRVDPKDVNLTTVPTPFEALVELGYNTFVHVGDNNYMTQIEG